MWKVVIVDDGGDDVVTCRQPHVDEAPDHVI